MTFLFFFLLKYIFSSQKIVNLIKYNRTVLNHYIYIADEDTIESFLKICISINICNRLAINKNWSFYIDDLLKYDYIKTSLLERADKYLLKVSSRLSHILDFDTPTTISKFYRFYRKHIDILLKNNNKTIIKYNLFFLLHIFTLSTLIDWYSDDKLIIFFYFCYNINIYATRVFNESTNETIKTLICSFFENESISMSYSDFQNIKLLNFFNEFDSIILCNNTNIKKEELCVSTSLNQLLILYNENKKNSISPDIEVIYDKKIYRRTKLANIICKNINKTIIVFKGEIDKYLPNIEIKEDNYLLNRAVDNPIYIPESIENSCSNVDDGIIITVSENVHSSSLEDIDELIDEEMNKISDESPNSHVKENGDNLIDEQIICDINNLIDGDLTEDINELINEEMNKIPDESPNSHVKENGDNLDIDINKSNDADLTEGINKLIDEEITKTKDFSFQEMMKNNNFEHSFNYYDDNIFDFDSILEAEMDLN